MVARVQVFLKIGGEVVPRLVQSGEGLIQGVEGPVDVVDEIGGTEYTVTGSYEGTETLDKKLHRIMEQNAADDELGITEDGE